MTETIDPQISEDHLRIELTVLDAKLFREAAEWPQGVRSRLLFCTKYEDAIAPPWPSDGKQGLSVWVGPLAAFKDPKVRLLWELEKRRKRSTIVVLTSQKGRAFLRSYREMGTLLSDTTLAPFSFVRRRGREWDSLDFFSPGDSPFMEGAKPRLKRLKQAAWEYLVDTLAMVDPEIKKEYFETLNIERNVLLQATTEALRRRQLSPLVGIAGECLNKECLFGLLEEPLLAGVIDALKGQPAPPPSEFLLLAKRSMGEELLLFGDGSAKLEVGQILQGAVNRTGTANEFAVSQILQELSSSEVAGSERMYRVKVDWRYSPDREISSVWKLKSVRPAGSDPTHGKVASTMD